MKGYLEHHVSWPMCLGMRLLALSGRASGLALGLALSFALTVAPASAATITVTNANDSGANSLRAAIASASAGDTIAFNLPANSTITLSSELEVDKDLTVDGSGSTGLAISGDNLVRVFYVSAGVDATFSDLIIRNGSADFGGGIYNSSTSKLTLNNCTVSNNRATNNGGGIVSDGDIEMTDTTVSGNTAGGSGGGIANGAASLTLTRSTVSGNTAEHGGGIGNSGTVTLTDSAVTGNTGNANGGGITSAAGSVALVNTTVSGNTTPGNGGGIVSDAAVTLTGSVVSGNTAGGSGGGIAVRGSLALTNTTVSGNTADFGGGINSLQATTTITDSVITNNTGNAIGGGIINSQGTLTLTNSTVSNNTTPGNGGGLANNEQTDVVTLTDSTVSGNTADGVGGGIANSGILTLTRSTVSGNAADSGGGIDNYQGTVSLTNSTVTGNQATTSGGGVQNYSYDPTRPGAATLINVTLTGNGSNANFHAGANSDAQMTNTLVQSCDGAGTVTDNGGNLDDGTGCGFAAADSNAVFNLGALTDNGGATLTMMPNAGSPALGHGLAAACAVAAVDQRGAARPGTGCTSGAMEFGAASPMFRLTVSVVGDGHVEDNTPGQIGTCAVTGSLECTALYASGASVTLTAVPASGYTFSGWSGDCTGTSPATVTMDQVRVCSAQFTITTQQPRQTAAPIPTLGHGALLLLGMLIAGVAARITRKRRA